MTYKVGAVIPSPELQLAYNNISGDNNGNGYFEPGENGDINIDAKNAGQSNSGTIASTCTALGGTSGYVTVISTSVNAGIIAIAQTKTISHKISIHPDTPVGTQIVLKFTVSDGTYSTYFTKTFIVGEQILMDNQSCSSCSAVFYDSGGPFANYEVMIDYTKTISSTSSNRPVKVEFLTFDLEADPDCGYDYLQIFNGSSVSSPLLGTYCGKNSPGIITSTDPGGDLTFRFHSDPGWRCSGWSALITCDGTVLGSEEKVLRTVKIFPNPSAGIVNIKVDGEMKAEIKITDLNGDIVYDQSALICDQNIIDLSKNPGGIYFMNLKSGNQTLIQKIIISK
jgi:hypothetical protein